jgi:hypothetical protein
MESAKRDLLTTQYFTGAALEIFVIIGPMGVKNCKSGRSGKGNDTGRVIRPAGSGRVCNHRLGALKVANSKGNLQLIYFVYGGRE